jgi:uncharacterized protein YllA (UPF0747 family)
LAVFWRLGQDGDVAEVELSEHWASLAEPLRALMAEVEREAHADGTTPPDLAAVSARWARVSDAIRATVYARIVAAQAAQALAPKR